MDEEQDMAASLRDRAVLGVLARRASGGNVRNIYDTLYGAYSMRRIRADIKWLQAAGFVEVMPTKYRRISRWRVTPVGFTEALGIPYPVTPKASQ